MVDFSAKLEELGLVIHPRIDGYGFSRKSDGRWFGVPAKTEGEIAAFLCGIEVSDDLKPKTARKKRSK